MTSTDSCKTVSDFYNKNVVDNVNIGISVIPNTLNTLLSNVRSQTFNIVQFTDRSVKESINALNAGIISINAFTHDLSNVTNFYGELLNKSFLTYKY